MTENDDENLNAQCGDPLCNFLNHFHWKLIQPLNLPWSNYSVRDTFFIARAISGVKVCSEKTPFKSDFLTVCDCIKKAGMWSVNRATPARLAGVARSWDHFPPQAKFFDTVKISENVPIWWGLFKAESHDSDSSRCQTINRSWLTQPWWVWWCN